MGVIFFNQNLTGIRHQYGRLQFNSKNC